MAGGPDLGLWPGQMSRERPSTEAVSSERSRGASGLLEDDRLIGCDWPVPADERELGFFQ